MEREEDEAVASLMRSLGIDMQDEDSETISPLLVKAGPKLKAFRESSGWTASEISERTGVPLAALESFEAGEPASEDVLLPAMERLATACCCTVEELGLAGVELRRPVRRTPRPRPRPLW